MNNIKMNDAYLGGLTESQIKYISSMSIKSCEIYNYKDLPKDCSKRKDIEKTLSRKFVPAADYSGLETLHKIKEAMKREGENK